MFKSDIKTIAIFSTIILLHLASRAMQFSKICSVVMTRLHFLRPVVYSLNIMFTEKLPFEFGLFLH